MLAEIIRECFEEDEVAIVDEGVDLASAAAQVAIGKHHNPGQICLSPDRMWVKTVGREEFLTHYLAWVTANSHARSVLIQPEIP